MLKRSSIAFIVTVLLFTFGFCIAHGGNTQAGNSQVEEIYGLVVGISEYSHQNLDNIIFAAEDAKSFYRLLLQEKMGDYSGKNLTLVTNESATTEGLVEGLRDLERETERDDLVVIYYSGHGIQGPDYNDDESDGHDEYFVTQDTDPSSAEAIYKTAYSDDQFTDALEAIPSNNIVVFLDCAYSGGLIDKRDFPSGTIMISASKENQPSWESRELDQGVFTHFLLEGLKGRADKDNNGKITSNELYVYLRQNVSEFVEENFSSSQLPITEGVIKFPLVDELKN